MNRIVREHYPVADLPENLREGLALGARVRVVIEPEMTYAVGQKVPFSLDDLFAKARSSFADFDDVSAHIRGLRDEWVDRR